MNGKITATGRRVRAALRARSGFSLIELVIVIVIIGIIAAIAIPRMSRGAAGAAENALVSDLAMLRSALDMYYTEHQSTYPDTAKISDQLTLYTDSSGNTSATKTGAFIYGPYLRKIPPLPLGTNKGQTGISTAAGASVGWIYPNNTSGNITANTGTLTDSSNVLYSQY